MPFIPTPNPISTIDAPIQITNPGFHTSTNPDTNVIPLSMPSFNPSGQGGLKSKLSVVSDNKQKNNSKKVKKSKDTSEKSTNTSDKSTNTSDKDPDLLAGKKLSNKAAWNEIWKKYGHLVGLSGDKAYIYLLGQLLHESADFKYMEEIASGSKYEGRKDLGNIKKGDGKRFKGRGPIQVTGRSNYTKIYKEFFIPNGLGKYNIIEHPELGSDPRIGSLMTIGWLTVTAQGREAVAAMNRYDTKAATKSINGGYNGLDNRIKIVSRLLKEAGRV